MLLTLVLRIKIRSVFSFQGKKLAMRCLQFLLLIASWSALDNMSVFLKQMGWEEPCPAPLQPCSEKIDASSNFFYLTLVPNFLCLLGYAVILTIFALRTSEFFLVHCPTSFSAQPSSDPEMFTDGNIT